MTTALCLLLAAGAFAQHATKPTIMVFPSETWCAKRGYMQTYDNQGTAVKQPDYQRALQEDMDLKLAIAKINNLMTDRGFPLQVLEEVLRNLQREEAQMNMVTSKSGSSMGMSMMDRLNAQAKSDIQLDLTWDLTEQGPKRTLTYILEARDPYTQKSIASAVGTSQPSFSASVPVLLEEAVVANIDNFNAQLQAYFDDLFQNGREVSIDIRVFEDNALGVDLETEYGDYELREIITKWMRKNTVEGRFSKSGSSEYNVKFTQVRIPLFDSEGDPVDTEAFVGKLRRFLKKEPYNLPSKVMTEGLGKVILVIGNK